MKKSHIPIPLDELPPDDLPEYKPQGWDDPVEVPVTPVEKVQAELKEKIAMKASGTVSAPKNADVGIPITDTVPTVTPVNKVGRKPTGTAMTNSERQAKWRQANLALAQERQRAAMKKIRGKGVE